MRYMMKNGEWNIPKCERCGQATAYYLLEPVLNKVTKKKEQRCPRCR